MWVRMRERRTILKSWRTCTDAAQLYLCAISMKYKLCYVLPVARDEQLLNTCCLLCKEPLRAAGKNDVVGAVTVPLCAAYECHVCLWDAANAQT